MEGSKDWRLMGQEKYLKNVELEYAHYEPQHKNNDHDHCEFCMSKFMDREGFLNEGYCTKDKYRWICPKCFNDFKEMFNWKVINE